MHALLLLFIGGTALTIGDIIFKFWVTNNKPLFFASGLAIYVVGLLFLIQTFKTEHIATASMIFIIFNIVTLALVSAYYFDEHLTNVQFAGVVLAMAAVAIMEFGR